MDRTAWARVDGYFMERLGGDDPVMEAVLAANAAGGLPAIDVSEAQGRFLSLMVRATGAGRVLEIGTLGGYSTIWMARALPAGGRIVTIECALHHAEIARGNLRRAGVEARVDLRVGPALDMLPVIAAEGLGPFDLVFIDADKPNNPAYLDWALRLARRGGVVLVDNVVRGGRVVEAESGDANVAGIRRMVEMLRETEGVGATAIQTVGAKGWDGFVMAVAG